MLFNSIVYTPVHIDGQKFVTNRDELIETYNNYSSKYSIRFYDYSKDSICLDRSYFYNSTHLNKKGSEIFSKKLANDLKVQQKKPGKNY